MAVKLDRRALSTLRAIVKKAGVTRTLEKAGISKDNYYNLINGRTNNPEWYDIIRDSAIDLVVAREASDYVE